MLKGNEKSSDKQKKFFVFSIRRKTNLLVIFTILVVAFGTSAIAFGTSIKQIDSYYKQSARDNAKNFASFLDAEYLQKLRVCLESEEYQKIRDEAEENEDEAPVEAYLKSKGLWEQYFTIRTQLTEYINNISNLKYLYIVAQGNLDAYHDMYILDGDEEVGIYESGYYEEREEELIGLDLEKQEEPTINEGDWGWLCSAYYPVHDKNGETVCFVGCDFDMEDVMSERYSLMISLVVGTIIIAAVMLVIVMLIVHRVVVRPLNQMTSEMKKFNPGDHENLDDVDIIDIDIKSKDEIGQIYRGIKSMQITIIDYLKHVSELKQDKLEAEKDIKDKEKEIGKLNRESLRDPLTRVGNKAAYIKKSNEINNDIVNPDTDTEFAVVMIDMNDLKRINDDYGHKSGDMYIKGCCEMICDIFKHSPVFRIGGDEFVVILQGRDFNKRQSLVSKLKLEFEASYNDMTADPWLRCSAAVGIAENASDDNSVEFVFKRADKAMYADKAEFKKRYGGYR